MYREIIYEPFDEFLEILRTQVEVSGRRLVGKLPLRSRHEHDGLGERGLRSRIDFTRLSFDQKG